MNRQRIVYAVVAVLVLGALAACGPMASPTPSPSPLPTAEPTDSPPPTATPEATSTPEPTAPPTSTPTTEPSTPPLSFTESFEGGLGGWQKGADVPEDPDRPGEPIAWRIDVTGEQDVRGGVSARFTIDGKQDDGTIWLERSFAVEPEATLRVELAFDLWSASESFNTLAKVAAYAGPEPPTQEGDFELSQAANLAAGWRTYEYAFDVDSGAGGQIWVALGISAVWETEMTYFVDQVRIDAAPPDQGQPPEGRIAIEGVQVTEEQVTIRGGAALPEGTCVSTELWAGGTPLPWWPTDACARVRQGSWELVVPLEPGQTLHSDVQYMVRAYQPGGPNVVSTFPFDLDGPPGGPPGEDPTLLLPESAEPLHRVSADLNGDGRAEEVVLTGWGGGAETLGYDFLQLFVISRDEDGAYSVAWQSEQLPTQRGEALQARDVNGDGLPEVLSVQSMGASGETLYVLSWKGDGYGWLVPHGGEFDGRDAFGEVGVSVEDEDGDGAAEIVARYGPAARWADVYAWDGEAYVYQETLGGSETSYERVPVPGAGLSLEVPMGWAEVDDATWAAPQDDALRLGVRWADLEPPQEPEAALLPQPSQTRESVPVELPWSEARRFVVEVYGEAPEGGQAPVVSVEAHVLAVVDVDGGRRAIAIFAAAPDAQKLTTLEPMLRQAAKTVVLE